MKIYFISLLLLLACLYPSLAQGSFENCCLKYSKEPKMSIKRKIVRFRIQESDGGCNRSAVIFTVLKKKTSVTFCADPTKSWVMKMVKILETKVENN
ncbi:C-C motif chemokine 25b [Tachysurus vachellii]|nr:C-C motif chemokine 25b [Tachysurus vachellii]